MVRPYVRTSERILFAIALVFSLIVYGLLAAGTGFVISKAGHRSVRASGAPTFQVVPDSGSDEGELDGEFDEEDFEDEEETPSADKTTANSAGRTFPVRTVSMHYRAASFQEDAFEEEDPFSNMAATALTATLGIFLLYLAVIVAFVLGLHIIMVGHLMGNGVRVNEKQFPELWAEFQRAAAELGVRKLPAFYLVESGGVLNAFATRLFTRNYVAIYSELAERLYEGDAGPVSFVIAHELVHVKRNHSLKGLLTLPAEVIPFLKGAWRRACEYTCDAGGMELAPEGAERGLIILAAGPKMAAKVDADTYLETFRAERSVWKRVAELCASHPHLPKRIAALRKRKDEYR